MITHVFLGMFVVYRMTFYTVACKCMFSWYKLIAVLDQGNWGICRLFIKGKEKKGPNVPIVGAKFPKRGMCSNWICFYILIAMPSIFTFDNMGQKKCFHFLYSCFSVQHSGQTVQYLKCFKVLLLLQND